MNAEVLPEWVNEVADEPEPVEPVVEEKPEPPKEPEPQEITDEDHEERPKDDDATKYRKVSAALAGERKYRREVEKELNTLREQLTPLLQLKQELEQQRASAAKKKADEEFEQDPAGVLKRTLEEVQGKLAQNDEQRAQAEQFNAFRNRVAAVESEYVKQTPDYYDAVQHMKQVRFSEYDMMGVPPEYHEQMFIRDAMGVAQMAFDSGRNFAEIVYNLAKQRGYSRKKEVPVEAKIEQIEKGQKAAKTLSGSGDSGLSLKSVEDMSDAEFDKMWKEVEKAAKKR